jgi:hypothetical protein
MSMPLIHHELVNFRYNIKVPNNRGCYVSFSILSNFKQIDIIPNCGCVFGMMEIIEKVTFLEAYGIFMYGQMIV